MLNDLKLQPIQPLSKGVYFLCPFSITGTGHESTWAQTPVAACAEHTWGLVGRRCQLWAHPQAMDV